MADAFVCAPASDVVSSLRETLCAVKANSLTVEVGVLEDVLYKGAVLLRLAESPWVRDVGGELGECLLSDRLHDRCAHRPRSDGHDPHAQRPEVTGGDERQPDDTGLGRRIGGLPDLALVAGEARRRDHCTALAIRIGLRSEERRGGK